MAEPNSVLSCGLTYPILQNITHGLPATTIKVFSNVLIQRSATYGGTYTDLVGSNVGQGVTTKGGCIKCITGPANVKVTKVNTLNKTP